MKKTICKKLLSVFCVVLALCLTMTTVYAATIENPIYDPDTGNSVYSYVYFGHYPQSEITGDDLTDDIIGANYNKYGFGIVDNKQIVRKAHKKNGETVYSYFLVEPIKWKVLNIDENYMLLLSDKILDVQYYRNYYGSSWKPSDLRSWLNGLGTISNSNAKDFTAPFESFQSVAFFEDEYDICQLMDVTYSGTTTSDYIVLPSKEMVTNNSYGFYKETYSSATRKKTETDYAKNSEDYVSYRSGYWHLLNYYVQSDGNIDLYNSSSFNIGVAPVVKILVDSDQYYTTEPELVMGKDIGTTSVSLKYTQIDYSGKAREPKVTVKDGTETLVQGVDYTLEYSDNVNAGTAKVTIKGCGNYYGTVVKNFTINRIKQTISRVESSYKKTYGDAAFRLNAITSGNGKITYASSDESVVIAAKNTGKISIMGPGTAKVTVTASEVTNYNKATKTVNITVLPQKVTGLKQKSYATNSVTLSWARVPKAQGYEIYRYNEYQEEFVKIKTITSGKTVSFKNSALSAGKVYQYKVKAYVKSGSKTIYGAYSSVFKGHTKPAVPTLKVKATAKGKATLTWKNVEGENGYEVYYSTKKTSGFKKLNYKANVKKSTLSGFKSKKTYYFKVKAYKKVNGKNVYSDYSKVVSVKIK